MVKNIILKKDQVTKDCKDFARNFTDGVSNIDNSFVEKVMEDVHAKLHWEWKNQWIFLILFL